MAEPGIIRKLGDDEVAALAQHHAPAAQYVIGFEYDTEATAARYHAQNLDRFGLQVIGPLHEGTAIINLIVLDDAVRRAQ